MIVLAVVVAAAVVVALARSPWSPPGGRAVSDDRLAAVLGRAVAAGVLTSGQADAVLASERAAAAAEAEPRGPGRISPVLEALGYFGGVLVMVGAALLVSRAWSDFDTWVRLAILGVAAAALTAGGLAVRNEREPVLWRLRSVLLFLATGGLAAFTGLLAVDGLDLTGEPVGLLTGSAVAAFSAALWARRDRPAQHLTCLGGLIAVVVAAVNWAGGRGGAVGLALWALGAVWLAASFRRLFRPAFAGLLAGGILLLVGAGATGAQWQHFGLLFGLATAVALLVVGIRTDEFPMTAVGVVGAFIYLPATVAEFFGETIGVPAVMLAAGLTVLGIMARLLRRSGGSGMAATGGGWRPHRPRHA